MDPATLARHAPEAPKRPLTLKEALSSVADFRIDRRKKFPLYEILMIAVCAMIDGAKGPAFGVASLRSVSAASVQQFSVQWEAGGSPLPAGRWPLAAGCWNTSAAGRPKVCMAGVHRGRHGRRHVAQGQPSGVASLRSASAANSQQSSAQWEAATPPSLVAGYWLLAAGTLPTHQKFVPPRVSGEKEFLMRWP